MTTMSLDEKLVKLLYLREREVLNDGRARPRGVTVDALLERALSYRRIPKSGRCGIVPEKLFLILTRACQLRCRYCPMSKSSEHMPLSVLKKGILFFMSGDQPNRQLHFFGGEPLLKFDLIQSAVELAERIGLERGIRPQYWVTTNGIAFQERMAGFFRKFGFTVVVSCDGGEKTFGSQRPGAKGRNFYQRVREGLECVKESGVPYYVTVTVSPAEVSRLEENVIGLAELGHKRIEVTYEVGCQWFPEETRQLMKAMGNLISLSRKSGRFEIINATDLRYEPVVVHSELALDVDGALYRHIGLFLEEGPGLSRQDFRVGALDDFRSLEQCDFSRFDDFAMLARAYARRNPSFRSIVLNNMEVGWALERFLRIKMRVTPEWRGDAPLAAKMTV